MSISDEFSFINSIRPKKSVQSSLVQGIGDDAALFSGNNMVEEIVCMDTMVEEIHFNRKTMKPYDIGYKILASNISDIAAMGGTPLFYLVSIAVPSTWTEDELLAIYEGMDKLATHYQMDLIGGDTVSTRQHLVITVTVHGRIEKGKHLLRSNAKPGDLVFVTGTPGDSAAGLHLLLEKGHDYPFSETEEKLVNKHQRPVPRVEVGKILSNYSRVALNDISDGIGSEANEIAEASGVTIIIEEDMLPFSEEIKKFSKDQQQKWSLFGGEDFELIGSISSHEWLDFQKECEKAGVQVTSVGTVVRGEAKVYLNSSNGQQLLKKEGYNHFSK